MQNPTTRSSTLEAISVDAANQPALEQAEHHQPQQQADRVTRRRLLQHGAAGTTGLTAAGLASTFWQPGALPTEALGALGNDPEHAREMMTPAARQAINRGLEFLNSHQRADGSIGSGAFRTNVAVCGLTGLAMLAQGSTPNRGRYGSQIDKCIAFLLSRTRSDGFIVSPGSTSHGPMYGHGFATLFLAECYGMTNRPDIRQKLSAAIRLIVNTQNQQGGWRYHPRRDDADLSVTICQVMALRAARNAGLFVPRATIEDCTDYVRRSQNPDGGFQYQLEGGPSAFPRSAAGVVALYMAGIYEGPEIDKGLRYLMTYLPDGNGSLFDGHYYYAHYYAVQAMWHAGGRYWDAWYPAIRDELVRRQRRRNGSWYSSACPEYGTAMACIILQLPNNFLPIIQR